MWSFVTSETLVEMNERGEILNVSWHGVLSDGTSYQSAPLPLTKDDENTTDKLNDNRIGTVAQGDWVPEESETPHQTKWWTKTHLDNETTLLTTAKGYDVHNCLVRR